MFCVERDCGIRRNDFPQPTECPIQVVVVVVFHFISFLLPLSERLLLLVSTLSLCQETVLNLETPCIV